MEEEKPNSMISAGINFQNSSVQGNGTNQVGHHFEENNNRIEQIGDRNITTTVNYYHHHHYPEVQPREPQPVISLISPLAEPLLRPSASVSAELLPDSSAPISAEPSPDSSVPQVDPVTPPPAPPPQSVILLIVIIIAMWAARSKENLLEKMRKSLNERCDQSHLTHNIILLLYYNKRLPQDKFIPVELEFNATHIDESELFDNATRVKVVADVGEGKTTWLEHAVFLWRQGKLWSDKFDLLFFIKLPDLIEYYKNKIAHKEELTIVDGIFKFCLTSKDAKYYEEDYNNHEIENLLLYHENKILFVLDAYDEVEHDVKTIPKLEEIIRKFLQKKYVLVTTRLYSEHYLSQIFKSEKMINIIGFADEKWRLKYADDVLSFANIEENKPVREPGELQKLKNDFVNFFLKNPFNPLGKLLQKPLYLQLICSLWEIEDRKLRRGNFPKGEQLIKDSLEKLTMTSIYRRIIAYLVRRFLEKEEKKQGKNLRDENFEITLKKEKNVLDFVKEVANHGDGVGANLLTNHAEKASMRSGDFEDRVLGINLITVERYSNFEESTYRFTHPFLKIFFKAWYKADQLISGTKPADIIHKYNLREWNERYRNYWQEIQELAYIAGILWVEQQKKAQEFIDFLLGKNIDKYTFPLAIILFEEIRFISSEHEWLDTIRNKIVALGREKILNLAESRKDPEEDFFLIAMNKAHYMKYYIASDTELSAIGKSTPPNSGYIYKIKVLNYFTEKTIQYLLYCLSSPEYLLGDSAKNALISAKIKKETILDSFYEEKDRDNLNPMAITRKAELLLELNYVDDNFLNELIDKSIMDEKKRMLTVIAVSVIYDEQKKEIIFDYLLDTLKKFPDHTLDIENLLVKLDYFREENLRKFSLAINSMLREEENSSSVIAYLLMLNKWTANILQKNITDDSHLLSNVIKLLDKKVDKKIEIIKLSLSLFSKLNTAKAFQQLVYYSKFFTKGAQEDESRINDLRGIAIDGLMNFMLPRYFDRIFNCLKERLFDSKETEANKIKAINFICDFYKIYDPLKINIILLNYFLRATADERKLIIKKNEGQAINKEIDIALKAILLLPDITLSDKKIVLKFVSVTPADDIKNILLNNKDSMLYEVSKFFIDEKIILGLIRVLVSPECTNDFKEKIQKIFIDLLSPKNQEQNELTHALLEVIDNNELEIAFFTDKSDPSFKIRLALLRYFLRATPIEKSVINKRITAQPINAEIDIALKAILLSTTSTNIALSDRKIVLKFISFTNTRIIEDILLRDPDSFLYEVSKFFIDEKVIIGLLDVFAMPKCPANIKAEIRKVFTDLLSSIGQKQKDLTDILLKIINGDDEMGLRTKLFMDELENLPFNDLVLTILIKALEVNFSLDFKQKICNVLDKFYKDNKEVFGSKLLYLQKENLGENKIQKLSFLQRVNDYHNSWWYMYSLYNYLQSDLEKMVIASAATRSIAVPFWMKPLHLVGNAVGISLQHMKAILNNGVLNLLDGSDRSHTVEGDYATDNVVAEAPNLVVEASLLVKTQMLPMISDIEVENRQKNDTAEADDHFTADRVTSSSVQTLSLTPIALGYVAVPLINKASERFGLFGHKPLTSTLVTQYETQHRERLSKMKASLDNMKRLLILRQRVEYQLAQEAFEQAYQRFKNYFRNIKLSNHAISESKNAEVLRLIDIAQQAFTLVETLQMKIDTEHPGFVQKIERITLEQNDAWEELQQMACVPANEIKKLQEQQNVISEKLMIDDIVLAQKELLEQEWDHLEERISHIRHTQKKLEPIYDAITYLLGKISDQLELGCLPEQFTCLQNELALAKATIAEISTRNTNLEEGLLAEVITMVDTLREVEVDKIHSQYARQAVTLEIQSKAAFSNFFKTDRVTDGLLTSTVLHTAELAPVAVTR